MKLRSRKGGAASAVVGIFIIAIVIISILHAILGLLLGAQNDNGFGPVNPWTPFDRNQTADKCDSNPTDNSIPNKNSTVMRELRDPAFWRMVQDSALRTAYNLPNDTVVGVIENAQEMRNWTLRHMPDAPKWVKTGFGPFISAQLVAVQAQALASGNVTQIEGFLEDQVARASGVGYALVNLVTLNSAAALLKYVETGNPVKAYCLTFPSQLDEVWHEAFNPNLTEEQRADYLGRAIAVSSVTVAFAGADGFSPKFKAVLEEVGLADSWDTVKPYLGKIGSVVSSRAAYLTLTLLEKLAQKFPSDARWVAGLTTDRIDSMAELLHGRGFSSDKIEQRIGTLVRAADNPSSEDEVATDADVISYKDGGSLPVKLGSEHQMYLYSDMGTMQFVKADFLESVVPGFKASQPTLLKIYYEGSDAISYHSYEGGTKFWATVPDGIGKPGDVFDVKISLLTRTDFVKLLPRFSLVNEAGFGFLPESVEVTKATITGDDLALTMAQDPEFEGVSTFVVRGHASENLRPAAGQGIYLQFDITNVFGQTRSMRLYHDGYSLPWFTLEGGAKFPSVSFIASDGVRLRIVYGSPELNVATIYLQDPSALYNVGEMVAKPLDFPVSGASEVFQIDETVLLRQTEIQMLNSGSNYPVGRVGAEIAYTVAVEKLGLKDMVLQDPSRGGADLFTKDGKVVVEARMLTSTAEMSSDVLAKVLGGQLADMVDRLLNWDFKPQNNPLAQKGYAVLSYFDVVNHQPVIKTIVVEVPKP